MPVFVIFEYAMRAEIASAKFCVRGSAKFYAISAKLYARCAKLYEKLHTLM